MAKTALEEWNALNRAINCKHYIGARRHKVITDALSVGAESTSKGDKSTPTPTIKEAIKSPVTPPIKPSAAPVKRATVAKKTPVKKAD